ncbi:MAG TPA: hypothetical protein PLY49_12715 [Opitutaceae bacterium]|nr:hypothetical protein [Opitutaceae bacterium]
MGEILDDRSPVVIGPGVQGVVGRGDEPAGDFGEFEDVAFARGRFLEADEPAVVAVQAAKDLPAGENPEATLVAHGFDVVQARVDHGLVVGEPRGKLDAGDAVIESDPEDAFLGVAESLGAGEAVVEAFVEDLDDATGAVEEDDADGVDGGGEELSRGGAQVGDAVLAGEGAVLDEGLERFPIEEAEAGSVGAGEDRLLIERDAGGHDFRGIGRFGGDDAGDARLVEAHERAVAEIAEEYLSAQGEDALGRFDAADEPGLRGEVPLVEVAAGRVPVPVVGCGFGVVQLGPRFAPGRWAGDLGEPPVPVGAEVDFCKASLHADVDVAVLANGDIVRDVAGFILGLADDFPAHAIADGEVALGDDQDASVRELFEVGRGTAQTERFGGVHHKGGRAGLDDVGRGRLHPFVCLDRGDGLQRQQGTEEESAPIASHARAMAPGWMGV